MSGSRKLMEEAIQAVVLRSPTSYWWFGKRSPQLSAAVKRLLPPNTARNYLLFNLQHQLYSDFYCRGFASPSNQVTRALPAVSKAPFVKALSAANSGTGYKGNGWEVSAIEHGTIVVERGELRLWVRPEDCLIPKGTSIVEGLKLSLRFPKEWFGISPGFYMAQSNEEFKTHGSQKVVRMYWNFTSDGALRFMNQATSMLNRARLPFNLKVLDDQNAYSRCDAVVLYICNGDYTGVARILRKIYRDLGTHLKPGTPVFTKPLAPGVGLAEDPDRELSFGEHRCRLLADGIIRAYEQGKKSLNERFDSVAERFEEAGIDVGKPFLNPGSSDDYSFEPLRKRRSKRPRGLEVAAQLEFNDKRYLATATNIANRLAEEAIWHRDRCNWLGAEPVDLTFADRQPKLSYRALGPELYDGTSGIALFLAELSSATGDSEARRTALGAISQALSRVEALPAPKRVGLYTGAIGVAFAAARIGSILAEEELLEQAEKLLRILAHDEQEWPFDLLSGAAGAIAALGILRDLLNVNGKVLIDFAVRLGDNLLKAANKSEVGFSWKSSASSKQRNLTGFSHGTAGVAYALLELFHTTGEERYRYGAQKAFEYERHWFDHNAGNWPDFREELGQGRGNDAPLSFASVWCHGAPGIALSRLRAFQLLGDETCRAEAITALETTRETIRSWLHSGNANYSLCHGLAGNAETLLYGCEVLGGHVVDDRKLVAEIADAGIERYAKRGDSWPCGVGGEETPSLMLGLAGIGHFYLRLHTPKIPSILILLPEAFSRRVP